MTARLRGTARVIATCTLAMLMTGCVKVDLNMQLHGDNTVSGTMVFAVSRDLLALTGSSADDLLGQITASAGPLPAGVGFQQSAYADDRFEGFVEAAIVGIRGGETLARCCDAVAQPVEIDREDAAVVDD